MDTLTKGFVPPKTLEEKLEQIQSERESVYKMMTHLRDREDKVIEELGLTASIHDKAKKYDELVAIVDKFYEMDEFGEFVHKDAGLDSIGEAVASYLKYI